MAERLRELPARVVVCVATGYGAEMLDGGAVRSVVRVGRMDAEAMAALMREERAGCVIDATHPYAVAASENIRAAAEAAGVWRVRVARDAGVAGYGEFFESAAAAAAALRGVEGNVLLAVGAKELGAFAAVPGFAERMFPRVLPAEESLRACAELGFLRSHVIAMQGPFTRELNRAVLRQYGISVLVTKDGGAAGGFAEKVSAAEDAGARVFVIGRPPEEEAGVGVDEAFAVVAARARGEGGL